MSDSIIYAPTILKGSKIAIPKEQEERIKKFVESEDMQVMLMLAQKYRPSTVSIEGGLENNNNQLMRIQGWELFENAIINCLSALKPPKTFDDDEEMFNYNENNQLEE